MPQIIIGALPVPTHYPRACACALSTRSWSSMHSARPRGGRIGRNLLRCICRLLAQNVVPPSCHGRFAFIADSGTSTRMTSSDMRAWILAYTNVLVCLGLAVAMSVPCAFNLGRYRD